MSRSGVIHYNWPGFSFDEFLRFAAEAGYSYVELMLVDVWPDLALNGDAEAMRSAAARVRENVASHGLQISALGAGNDFVQIEEDAKRSQIARMKTICEITRILGDETIVRSEGGTPKAGLTLESSWEAMQECFARCTPFLEELEVSLAIDNHGLLTNDGDRLLALLEKLDHPRIGANLDTMNFRWFGHDLETCNRFYEQLAPRVLHAHFKDGCGAREGYRGAALGEGEIDLLHALTYLKNADYDGVFTAEYEGPEAASGEGYRRCARWLQTHL